MAVIGLVLAGGQGRRLGEVRKADLRLANVPLWLWLEKTLKAQCDELVVSVGSIQQGAGDAQNRVVDDPHRVKGPAAGLLAGAMWCVENRPGALMLSVSVDTPFFPDDFVQRASPLLADEVGCVTAAFDGMDYPSIALWHSGRLARDLSGLPADPKGPRLRDIAQRLGVVRLDYRPIVAHNPFVGINTLADLLAISAREKALARLYD